MAVRFSAATQFYNTTTNLPASSTFTFTAWVLISVDRNDYSEVISFGSTYMSLSTQVDGTTVGVFDGGSYNGTPLGGTAFTVGTWAKVAVVVNGTNVSYYRAASPGAALTLSTASDYTSGAPTQLRIGAYFGDGFFWNGRVAGFKLWDAALSQAEIEHELAQYRPRRTANLLHFEPFVRTESTNYAGGSALTGGTGSTTEDGPPIPWTATAPKIVLPPGIVGPTPAVPIYTISSYGSFH